MKEPSTGNYLPLTLLRLHEMYLKVSKNYLVNLQEIKSHSCLVS